MESVKSAPKRKKSCSDIELPGDWFTWQGDFGNSIVSKTGDLLRVSFSVRHFESNQICYYSHIDRVSSVLHRCLICNTSVSTTENKPSNACRHVKNHHWDITHIYDDIPEHNKDEFERKWKEAIKIRDGLSTATAVSISSSSAKKSRLTQLPLSLGQNSIMSIDAQQTAIRLLNGC